MIGLLLSLVLTVGNLSDDIDVFTVDKVVQDTSTNNIIELVMENEHGQLHVFNWYDTSDTVGNYFDKVYLYSWSLDEMREVK